MKGFFEWFKSSTRIKRWLFLVLLGIVLCCFGFSKVLTAQELEWSDIGIIALTFVVGFAFVIIGIIYIQKRNLELLIQADTSDSGKNAVNVKSLIFNHNLYDRGPRVVVIGGGTGLDTVLEGIKKYSSNVTAIVTISDYGRMTSFSRKELSLSPLENIKGSLTSLAVNHDAMERLMNFTFSDGILKNINFGDLYLLALQETFGADYISKNNEILNIIGNILPVTTDEIKICAELKDGTVVEEKDKISEVAYEKVTAIQRIYISPSNVVPGPGVLNAIKDADVIIIGPGSLYTNIIPNLLVKNITKTIRESKAIKVYVSNIMTEPGQTDNYSISDHILALEEHIGKGMIDYCLCDTGEVTPELIRKYNKMGSELVEQDLKKASRKGMTIIQKDMSMIKDGAIRHDPDAIASSVMELIHDDLKFKDRQNSTQFALLHYKLRQQKRKDKDKIRQKKINQKKLQKQESKKQTKLHHKSKFQMKYKDRIESIQNSELTREQKIKNIEMRENKKKGKVQKNTK